MKDILVALSLRENRIHPSAFMLLGIVNDLNRLGRAYITECQHYYQDLCKNEGYVSNYTYSGVAAMLRTMSKRGMLEGCGRDGYVLTKFGKSLINK